MKKYLYLIGAITMLGLASAFIHIYSTQLNMNYHNIYNASYIYANDTFSLVYGVNVSILNYRQSADNTTQAALINLRLQNSTDATLNTLTLTNLSMSSGEYMLADSNDLVLYADDDITFRPGDDINLYADGLVSVDSDVIPATNMADDLGSETLLWRYVHGYRFSATDYINASSFWDDGIDLLARIDANNATQAALISAITDTNESARVNNMLLNCSANEQVFGFYSNGSLVCVPDDTGTGFSVTTLVNWSQVRNTTDFIGLVEGYNVTRINMSVINLNSSLTALIATQAADNTTQAGLIDTLEADNVTQATLISNEVSLQSANNVTQATLITNLDNRQSADNTTMAAAYTQLFIITNTDNATQASLISTEVALQAANNITQAGLITANTDRITNLNASVEAWVDTYQYLDQNVNSTGNFQTVNLNATISNITQSAYHNVTRYGIACIYVNGTGALIFDADCDV